MTYLVIALFFGLAGGVIGRIKGSSFVLWFLISALFPIVGLAAAVLYRFDSEEVRRTCPRCGKVCMLHDAICTRCGNELDYPDESELVAPAARA
jgi:ribosomal protein S27AE